MKIKKLREDIITPTRAYNGDAGIDVYAPENFSVIFGVPKQIKLGFAIEIEPDEVCIMSERSGMAIQKCITSIGNIIDSGYRGEVSIIFSNNSSFIHTFNKGDKIGQMVVCKLGNRNIEVVETLSPSQRDNNAHYSSGQ